MKKKIFGLWLSCHTQEEIAEMVGMAQQTINDFLPKKEKLPNSVKFTFQDNFNPPIYNIWKNQNKFQFLIKFTDCKFAFATPHWKRG